jgi:uncharacterized protein (TIGR02001 family)
MKKVVLSVVAALAFSAAPALAADMPAKALKVAPAAAPSPWDVAFGTAFTTDYRLRGISQSDRKPAVQGYFEVDFKPADWVTLYAGIWGSSINAAIANAEFDNSAGARFTWGNFGLDVGGVYYYYPDPNPNNLAILLQGKSSISYAEFYAKPSYKVADWLTVSGQIIGGDNLGNTGFGAWYYSGMVTVTPPLTLPAGLTLSASAEVGRQTYSSGYVALPGLFVPGVNGGVVDYTQWNAGIDLVYKAITLDLRYYDTDIDLTNNPTQCATFSAGTDACKAAFVAMLKFDTALSALK